MLSSSELKTVPKKKNKVLVSIGWRKVWNWKTITLLLVNIIVVLITLFPLLYAVSMSLKSPSEIYQQNASFFPETPVFSNYLDVFKTAPIATYIQNSLIVSIAITVSQIITSVFAAFSFHFLKFKGNKIVFALIMATMMVPGEAVIVSQYLMVSEWGWIDSFRVLIIPFMTSALGIFLFRQALHTFPMEIYESARMDGCSNIRFIFKILIPLLRPTIGALSVQSFLGAWNMYMWPLLVTNSDEYRTVQIGISMLNSIDSQSIVLMLAGVVVCMLPSLIIFIFGQKNMIKGLTSGAVKG
ncbi:ABC transporter permease [Ureibacillus massiliensis 4400831 = CIP 108448 = CCUG 49529]|uniref:ABC transporter permease n=1 Tax=Ureibacillus massiliensis 4400831 = CIP 108448 = CCUG 49529 TaxID=1211035 RepID=A0A0A3IWA3_9BACL|nr:carbohydrate ABC transporter permease [Ureibacillus massiliensis]KGR88976.1 ABC transporter permease [Ureibacillus massiliensis 4400831 = CIP 108448 = CCUG 49529]